MAKGGGGKGSQTLTLVRGDRPVSTQLICPPVPFFRCPFISLSLLAASRAVSRLLLCVCSRQHSAQQRTRTRNAAARAQRKQHVSKNTQSKASKCNTAHATHHNTAHRTGYRLLAAAGIAPATRYVDAPYTASCQPRGSCDSRREK